MKAQNMNSNKQKYSLGTLVISDDRDIGIIVNYRYQPEAPTPERYAVCWADGWGEYGTSSADEGPNGVTPDSVYQMYSVSMIEKWVENVGTFLNEKKQSKAKNKKV